MAHLILKRGGGWRDRLRSYRVLVDGTEVERLRSRAAAHVEVKEGIRYVQLMIDGYGSRIHPVLSANECPAIFWCSAGSADFRAIHAGRASHEDYINLGAINPEDCARSYIKAASGVAAYATAQKTQASKPSRFNLSDSDLAMLFHACRRPNAILGTREGSTNHALWSELAKVGWMKAVPVPKVLPPGLANFMLSDYGRIELLDIL